MLAMVGTTVWEALFSNAHVCLAPSICRRLLMQALDWALRRARTKFGMAMVANRPMMATTIMISTSVKPPVRDSLIFILCSFLAAARTGCRRVYNIMYNCKSGIACDPPRLDPGQMLLSRFTFKTPAQGISFPPFSHPFD